jgi:hypothetical protein
MTIQVNRQDGPMTSVFTCQLSTEVALAGIAYTLGEAVYLSACANTADTKLAEWTSRYSTLNEAFADFENWAVNFNNIEKEVANG